MLGFEPVLAEAKPSLVVVAGDVNSTAACALVAAKLRIPVGHVEAGLRSFDRTMPEEINRIVTDHLSDLLFTTEESGCANLAKEGIEGDRIFFVGNTMVDTLRTHEAAAVAAQPWQTHGLVEREYGVVTLHRPSNVDDEESLSGCLAVLGAVASRLPLLFPAHPRTRAAIRLMGVNIPSDLILADPMPYLEFLGLIARAKLVLTDSGGIQEETTALGVPCLTMRANTERPVTVSVGTNVLVGSDLRPDSGCG